MRLLEGEGEKGVKNKQERLEGAGTAKEGGEGVQEWRECVFPGVSGLSCRVVHHCVPGDCVCGLAPL